MSFQPDDLNYPQTRLIYSVEIIRALAPFCIPVIKWDAESSTLNFNDFLITRRDDNTYDVGVVYDIPAKRDSPPDSDVAEIADRQRLCNAVAVAIRAYYDMERDARLQGVDFFGTHFESHPERVYYDAVHFLQSSGIDVSVADNNEQPEKGEPK